jgi:hypothetical protein
MHKLFKKTAITKTIFFVVADIVLITTAVLLAFLIRFDGSIPAQYSVFIYRMMGLAVVFTLPIFYFQGLYSFRMFQPARRYLYSRLLLFLLSF